LFFYLPRFIEKPIQKSVSLIGQAGQVPKRRSSARF
jgi:hypothetical protein